MQFRRNRSSRLVDAALDLTPLIDVVFLLVIFLLVSTTFKKKRLALEMDMPRAGTAEYKVSGREHQLRVDPDGKLYLCPNAEAASPTDALKCDEPIDRKTLVKQLRELSERFPGIRLGVYAGAKTNYELVLKVVAAATEAGIDLNLPYETEGEAGAGGQGGGGAQE